MAIKSVLRAAKAQSVRDPDSPIPLADILNDPLGRALRAIRKAGRRPVDSPLVAFAETRMRAAFAKRRAKAKSGNAHWRAQLLQGTRKPRP